VGTPRGTLLFNENYRCWQPLISLHFKFTLVSVVLESLIAQAVSYIMLKLGFDLLYEQTRLHLYIHVCLKHLVLDPGSGFNESVSTIWYCYECTNTGTNLISSVADPKCLPDPNFSIPDSGTRVNNIPDPHQRIEVPGY
jgi:hypothetical protein